MRRTYIVTYVDAMRDDGAGKVKKDTREVLAETPNQAAGMVYAGLPSGKRPSDILDVTPKPRVRRARMCECGQPIETDRVKFGLAQCAACAVPPAPVLRQVFIAPPKTLRTTAKIGKATRKVQRNPLDINQHRIPRTRKVPTFKRATDPLKRLAQTGSDVIGAEESKPKQFASAIRDRSPEYVAAGSAAKWLPGRPQGRKSK